MPLINNNRNQVDLPAWEQLRFAPAVSSALSATCSADNQQYTQDHGRYVYYLIGTGQFWRYDTITDMYQQLTSPPIAPLTFTSLKFSGAYGFEGSVLGSTGTTFTAPAFYGQVLKGHLVRIIGGTGMGQERIITGVADPVRADGGVVTAVTVNSITDTTKAWAINQWVGHQVRFEHGTGVSQVRRIIYNDATSLTFVDINHCAVNANANPQPLLPAPVATAGAQAHYIIESSVVTVDSAWTTNPDVTSRFRVFSGAIIMLSSAAGTAFYSLQMYDIASDTWYIRTATGSLALAAGTDGSLERTTENASVWDKGQATGGTTTTLINTAKSWTANEHAGRYVRIFSGAGRDQIRLIASNTATTLTWASAATAPNSTSQYMIDGFDAGTATAGGASTLTDTGKAWEVNRWKNYAVRIVAGTGRGQALPILSNTATALTLYKPWATAPDNTSQYIIQGDKDNAYIFLGGQSAVIVHSLEADMATYGRSNDDGLIRTGSARYADHPAIPITSGTGAAGTITITTSIPHGFRTGFTIVHRGDTGASAVQNNISATITVLTPTTYTYVAAGSTAAWTLTALSTTVLKDASKAWTVNEHANKVVYYTTAVPVIGTGTATAIAMEIASNTADTLTLKTAATLPVNGASRYIISNRPAIGAIDSGIATGTHSTTTLQDTSKTWVVNQWAGRRLKMVSGASQTLEVAITSNTANTLTFAAIGLAPISASTSYSILGGAVRGTGINATWSFGVSDASKRGRHLIIARGGAVSGFDKLDLTTDLWEALSTSPQFETLTTGSMYAYDGLNRLYFTKEATLRNYYIDLDTNKIHGAGITPYVVGTAILGNRYEVITTVDGLKYLWTQRHSFTEAFRHLITY